MPQTLEWSDSYSVAHPALDAEHRAIMLTISRIAEVDGGDVDLRPLLCELKERTASHFEHENTILRALVASTSSARRDHKFLAAMGQALIEEHVVEHDLALAALESMIRQTLLGSRREMGSPGETLTHWFVNHAVKHDAHLKTLFQTIEQDCPELLNKVA